MTAAKGLTSTLENLLTPSAVADFDENGFIVFSPEAAQRAAGAVWREAAHTFLDEIKKCHYELKATSPNMVEFLMPNGPIQLVKPNVFECDLHDRTSSARQLLQSFDELLKAEISKIAELFAKRCETLRTLIVSPTDPTSAEIGSRMEKHTTLKIQVNEGGCFPWHYDNPGPPNKRLVTLAVYLAPQWAAGDGGELVLQPFLSPEILVPPSFMTIAIFRSDTVCHRVRQLRPRAGEDKPRPRFCFTVWFDGCSTNADEDVNIRVKHLQESFIPSLLTSPLQRTLSRAVYSEAYEQALIECFGVDSKECRVSLAMHAAHCKALLGNPQANLFVDELRRRITT
jgi:hypothetical protein